MIRLAILNFSFACFLAWAWSLGYVGFVFSHDVSHISYLISAVFAYGIFSAFRNKKGNLDKIEVWLVTLGLIGNVVGFIIALQKIDVSALGSADGVQHIAASLLSGMGTAFCSTLVGAIGALWLNILGCFNESSQ